MTSDEKKYVMLSYNHNSKNIVVQVKEQLEKNGIPVWFDERDMDDNMYDSMPKAVGNAFVVCCFMTADYEKSRNCKLELEHAQRSGKRIIPCMVNNRKVWKPCENEWLNFITGSIIAIDFSGTSEEPISATINKLIDRINEKPSSSSTVSKPSDIFISIRHEYLRNSRIHRMLNEEKSFSIEESYINLAIVGTEEQREKEKKLGQAQYNDGIISSFEEIYGTKTSVDVKEIFEKCENKTKKVLVLGRAGIGKSTFCRYVSYQWAKGELWTQYQLVILIRLRLLTSSRYPLGQKYLPVDLVEKEYFPCDTIPDKSTQRFKELCNNGQVLWLLDGYDEFVQNIPDQLNDLFDYILKTQHHILTSRPYSIALPYEVKMEIIGFTDNNIEKYVEQFLYQIQNQLENALSESYKLLNFLKMNPGIWGVAHIPVNLELICSVWGDFEKSQVKITTMTSLYDTMTEWLCRRYLTKQKNILKEDVDAMYKSYVYAHCKKELIFLENLAFAAMKSNTLIIQPPSIETAFREADATSTDVKYILNIGVLKSFNTNPNGGNRTQTNKDYYLIHLSFQEYFAARYLVNALSSQSPQEAIEFIKNNKYNQRFGLLFTFASGLLTEPNSNLCLDTFWNALLAEPLDLVGLRHIELVISCIEEINDKLEVPRRAEIIHDVKKWIKYALSTTHKTVYNRLTTLLQRSISLLREETIKDSLIELLNSSNAEVRKNVCLLISALSTYSPQQQFLSLMIVAANDSDTEVMRSACEARDKLAAKAATSEVISTLVTALTDEDVHVRRKACEALGKLGEKAATSEVISKLASALGDKNDYVRRTACETLGEMGEKVGTSEVISKLVSALGDEDVYVRRSASKTLSKMGAKVGTSEVINKLARALGDEDVDVKYWACEALGKIGEKAATSEVISKLASTLGDKDVDVRSIGCDALGKIGEKAAKSEVITKLASALGDEDVDVRRKAANALVQIGEKAGTSEVISKLVSALGDENTYIRSSACYALGEMGERAATNEVISKLASALGDENKYIRSSACEALGKIGEKAATSAVISKLASAFGDEDKYIRSSACYALGEMGEKAATSEAISKLLNALGDKNEYVRRTACETLGKMGEKIATSEVVSKLVSALGDEDVYVRRKASIALVQIGEKTAKSEVVSKLVSALGDEDADVRSIACEALGKIGEKVGTSEVISKLASALGDEDRYVRSTACVALGKMGEKAATSEMINKLLNALGDKNDYVRRRACETLGKIGEKAATNEVVTKLLELIEKHYCYELSEAKDTLEKYFSSLTVVTELDTDTGLKLLSCLDPKSLKNFRFNSPEVFIEIFLRTKSSVWLSVSTRVALIEGVGVTVAENTIVIYGSKEPVKLDCKDKELVNQFVSAFMEHAVMLDLPCFRPEKADVSTYQENEFSPPAVILLNADVKRENDSSKCSVQ